MEYRITITKDRTSGKFVLEVPDVPEAHTIGASKSGVIARGVDALATALDGYMAARRPIPTPGPIGPRTLRVTLPPLMTIKLGLYEAMRQSGLSKLAVAKRLGWHPPQVDRLLDLRHLSKMENLEAAAALFHQRIVVALERVA
jgi:antitoxin HicB